MNKLKWKDLRWIVFSMLGVVILFINIIKDAYLFGCLNEIISYEFWIEDEMYYIFSGIIPSLVLLSFILFSKKQLVTYFAICGSIPIILASCISSLFLISISPAELLEPVLSVLIFAIGIIGMPIFILIDYYFYKRKKIKK